MINTCRSRYMAIPFLWVFCINGQCVVEAKISHSDQRIACYAKLITNACYWEKRGNLLLACECLELALADLEVIARDAVRCGDDENLEWSRDDQASIRHDLYKMKNKLRHAELDISRQGLVPPEYKQRLIRSLENMEKWRRIFWAEWAQEETLCFSHQEPLISNVTEKEFILLPNPPHKKTKSVSTDFSPRDVCDLTCEVDAHSVSSEK